MKTIKIICLILACLFVSNLTLAQRNTCGTIEHMKLKLENDPLYAASLESAEEELSMFINSKKNSKSKNSSIPTLKIPVVVHVLYKTTDQNISDAQIKSQLKVMNEDFRRLNPDTGNTPDVWKNIAADSHIEFCLATKDPNGNPTNGILRRPTKINSFTTDDKVKFTNQGGDDAWDTKRYLNIWVCNLTGGLLGYGEFPTSLYSNTYGFVVAYFAFGTEGNVNTNTKRGRTTIHEISHCFNLRHIWADDGGGCNLDDGVDDTPKQAGPSNGCPKFPYKDACQIDSPGIMFMNYMDYSNDACMNMFTEGQTLRMRSAIDLFYPTLNNPSLCDTLNLVGLNSILKAIHNPIGDVCNDSITPQIVISNIGFDTIKGLKIKTRLDNSAWTEYIWTGEINTLNDKIINLPTIYNVTNGNHRVVFTITQINGIDIQPKLKDSLVSLFSAKLDSERLPYAESFESTPFPGNSKIKISNSGGVGWQKTSKSAYEGTSSIFIDNKLNDHEGDIDAFVLPNIDLASFTGIPYLKFRWAYARQDNTTSDALQILLSTDCGYSFTSIFSRTGGNLVTAVNQSGDFVPMVSEWREAIVSLNNYKSYSNIVLAFQNVAGGNGNNLFIDNINIGDRFTGLNSIQKESSILLLFPNPVQNTLYIEKSFSEITSYEIVDLSGKILLSGILSESEAQIDVDKLSKGMYLIVFKNSNLSFQKFIKQ